MCSSGFSPLLLVVMQLAPMCPLDCKKLTTAPRTDTENGKGFELMEQDARSDLTFLLQSEVEVRGTKSNNFGLNKTRCKLTDLQGFPAGNDERALATTKLTRALALCLVFMVLEIVGGRLAGSLAVLADAAHMLSDVAGFGISLLALRASGWLATPQQTFGYLRLEVLGALVSVQIIWVMTEIILYEAFQRLYHGTQTVDGRLMICVACIGLVLNFIMIFILGHTHDHGGEAAHWHGHGQCDSLHNEGSHTHEYYQSDDPEDGHSHGSKSRSKFDGCSNGNDKEGDERHSQDMKHGKQHWAKGLRERTLNINLRGAYLHALGDFIQNIGVLVTGVVIWIKPEWKFVDLLCSIVFSIVVLMTTMKMLKDILWVLMESCPKGLDVEMLKSGLLQISGISTVLDIHVWALTTGINLMSCHVEIKPGAIAKEVLHAATEYCYNLHQINHVTIQIEEAA